MKNARLIVYQRPRNPTERERRILALLAGGLTQKQAAGHLGVTPRAITACVEKMRDRYTAPTNEALIALAVRLQWIEIAVDIHQDGRRAAPRPRGLQTS